MLGAQHGLDPDRLVRDVAAPGTPEHGADLGDRQLRRRDRVRRLGQQLQGISGIQILKGRKRSRKVVPQRVAQSLDVAGALPNHTNRTVVRLEVSCNRGEPRLF
jgi:hypothetical protein